MQENTDQKKLRIWTPQCDCSPIFPFLYTQKVGFNRWIIFESKKVKLEAQPFTGVLPNSCCKNIFGIRKKSLLMETVLREVFGLQCYWKNGSVAFVSVNFAIFSRTVFMYYTHRYGCSFVAKLSKKKSFFLKKYCFLQNIRYLQKKMFLYEKKIFIEKNINGNVRKISNFRNVFLHRKCLCFKQNINFLNIYSFCKKIFFLIIKNIFVKTSLWTQ